MQCRPAYAVILDTDRATALSLRHMFAVICGLSCEVYSDVETCLQSHCAETPPAVMILGNVAGEPAQALKALLDLGTDYVVVLDRKGLGLGAEQAFLLGAHDVIHMPCSLREIALRLRARIGMLDAAEHQDLFLDAENWDEEAYIAGQAGLTDAESQIVHILISQHDQIVSRDALSMAIDGRAWDYGDRKFDVHVAKIRKKLTSVFGEDITVQTVRSAGYILTINEQGYDALMNFGA